MQRAAAPMNPGKANRRFVMLAIVLGLLGAVLVYIAFSRTKSTSEGAPGVPVVVAKADIPARTKITGAMVEVRLQPADTRSILSFADVNSVINKIARFPISANEQVLSNKVVDFSAPIVAGSRSLSFVVPQGMRAMAINVKPVTAAGGLVLP